LSHAVTYLDVEWTCGAVACSFCTAVRQLSDPKEHCRDCLMSPTQSLRGRGPGW